MGFLGSAVENRFVRQYVSLPQAVWSGRVRGGEGLELGLIEDSICQGSEMVWEALTGGNTRVLLKPFISQENTGGHMQRCTPSLGQIHLASILLNNVGIILFFVF